MFTGLVLGEREFIDSVTTTDFANSVCRVLEVIALKYYWKIVVKFQGPNFSNLPATSTAVYFVVWICWDALLEQKPQVSGHQEVVPRNRVLLLLLAQLLEYCCAYGNTQSVEGLRLVYMRSSQQGATGAAGPVIAGFGERQKQMFC